MLERWTRAMVRFRVLVLATWLAVVAVGAVSAARLPALLSTSLTIPGTSSERANTLLTRRFGQNPEGTFTVVFRVRGAPVRPPRSLVQRIRAAAGALPHARTEPARAASGVVYGNVVTRLDLQHAQGYTDALRHALAGHPTAYVTGAPALQHDLNPILAGDLRKGETIAIPLALLMLALVLGVRGILIVPLVFAASTIGAALAIVYALAHAVVMVSYVPNLVELVGLGLAIDYSLLFVHRFREEAKDEDRSVEDAVVRTMATAGRAVIFSGAAVAIGLSVVLIVPVPFIRLLGVAGVIVPLVSIVAALTVQPALLSLLGRGGLREAHLFRMERFQGAEHRLWMRLPSVVIRRRVPLSAIALALLLALALPIVRLKLTPGSLSTIPRSAESGQGLALLRDRVGSGSITPLEVVIDAGAPGRARAPAVSAATLRLARELLQDSEAFVVAIGSKPPFTDASDRYHRVTVVPRHEFGTEATQELVRRLRRQLIPAARFPTGLQIWTGGAPAQGVDFLDRAYGAFPWIILSAMIITYLVLLRAFRSIILPLVAVLLDVLSVAAAYGLLVLDFQGGIGADLLGLYRASQIEGWVPVLLFATLFGLSMDYQVFLVARMREWWDAGSSSDGAITEGLERTGRIVSAAAVIMVASFSGFTAGRIVGLQELGTGLALGVLLDATVVRILLMPSLMALLGRWSWWLPSVVARAVRVEASPLAKREGRGLSRSA